MPGKPKMAALDGEKLFLKEKGKMQIISSVWPCFAAILNIICCRALERNLIHSHDDIKEEKCEKAFKCEQTLEKVAKSSPAMF